MWQILPNQPHSREGTQRPLQPGLNCPGDNVHDLGGYLPRIKDKLVHADASLEIGTLP